MADKEASSKEEFSALNKTLGETTKFLRKKADDEAKSAEKTRKGFERIAKGDGEAAKRAQKRIANDDAAANKATQQRQAQNKLLGGMFGISNKRLKKADDLADKIAAQKMIMEEQKNALAETGVEAENVPSYQKEQTKLMQLEYKRSEKLGAATAEDEAKLKAQEKKTQSILGKIAGGIGGLAKSTKDSIKSGLPSWKSLVMGGLAAAALVFLNHPKFKEFIEVIKKEIIPALTTLIDDYIIPIAKILWGGVVKAWEIIKTAFSGLKESFKLFSEGKWWEGIKKFFSTIGTALGNALDLGLTTIFNVIAQVFGLEKTDSVFGSIKKFFMDIYHDIINYFTLSKLKIKTFFSNLLDKVTDFFSFDIEGFKKEFGLGGNLIDIVYAPLNLAINAVKKMFKFGDPKKPFRLSEFIGEAITKIVDFFKGILDFDIKEIVKSIPGGEALLKLFEDSAQEKYMKEVVERDEAQQAKDDAMYAGYGNAYGEAGLSEESAQVQRKIAEQTKALASGDRIEGVKFFGGKSRADTIKNLEAELAQIKRETAAKGSGPVVVDSSVKSVGGPVKNVSHQATTIGNQSKVVGMVAGAGGY